MAITNLLDLFQARALLSLVVARISLAYQMELSMAKKILYNIEKSLLKLLIRDKSKIETH